MKKVRFSVVLSMAILLGVSQAMAQVIPPKVQEAFAKKFPKAKLPEWQLDDDIYVVTFTQEEISIEAAFEKTGRWVETKSTLTIKALSQESIKAIALRLPESELEEVTLIERPGSKSYEVGVVTKEESYVIVVLNDKGKITEVN